MVEVVAERLVTRLCSSGGARAAAAATGMCGPCIREEVSSLLLTVRRGGSPATPPLANEISKMRKIKSEKGKKQKRKSS